MHLFLERISCIECRHFVGGNDNALLGSEILNLRKISVTTSIEEIHATHHVISKTPEELP
jgi:hypothetical protein